LLRAFYQVFSGSNIRILEIALGKPGPAFGRKLVKWLGFEIIGYFMDGGSEGFGVALTWEQGSGGKPAYFNFLL
jgi:hypothetical protein